MNGDDLKDLAFYDQHRHIESVKNPSPAQLEAFFEAYADFMASYGNEEEEDAPQAD
jgi:hypothetical protein